MASRPLAFAVSCLCAAGVLRAQALRPGENQLDASPALFTVLAAINAAGYDAGLESPSNHPLRRAVRQEIGRRKPASLDAIREFYRQHRQEDANWELRQYISFALLVDGPPNFEFRLKPHQLPPDVAALDALRPLVARFHAEAGIDELWKQAQPAFDAVIARYHEPVARALLELNGYLRNPTSGGFLGRRFQIHVDLLGAPNQIQASNFLDDYYVVVTASPEPHVADIRRQYLHYLLDPLATKYAEELEKKRGLSDYAQGAPHLADHFKQDFLLLATRSLIHAVESRLAPPGRRQTLVDEALAEGFVLTPHFAEQLRVYEKQEQAMRLYFPELVNSIDLKKEERRLEKVEFAAERRVRRAKPVDAPKPPEPTGPQKTLLEAMTLYDNRDLEKSRQAFLRLLRETEQRSLHAKAYYGLARIAALQKDPELAEKLFQKTLELGPDPQDRGWTLVYLGRLADLAGERDAAAAHYKAALAVEGASANVRQAAESGLKEVFRKKE